jgi:hypothetical protein
MKPEIVEQFSGVRDFYSLTKNILSICAPYGPVHSFRFVHNRGAARVACIIELESPKQTPARCAWRSRSTRIFRASSPIKVSPLAYAPPSLRAYVGIRPRFP